MWERMNGVMQGMQLTKNKKSLGKKKSMQNNALFA